MHTFLPGHLYNKEKTFKEFVPMKPFLLVALGGGAGAVCRYALTLLPISGRFPLPH